MKDLLEEEREVDHVELDEFLVSWKQQENLYLTRYLVDNRRHTRSWMECQENERKREDL